MGTPLKDENFHSTATPPKTTSLPAQSILKESTRDNLVQLQTPGNKQLSVHFENTAAPATKIYGASSERSPVIKDRNDSGSLDDLMGIMGKLQLNSAKKTVQKLSDGASDKENCAVDSNVTSNHKTVCMNNENQIPGALCGSSSQDITDTCENPVETVSYKIDFDHIEDVDPFKTKSAIANSPLTQRLKKPINDSEPSIDDDDDVITFKPSAVVCSPTCDKAEEDNVGGQSHVHNAEPVVASPLQLGENDKQSSEGGHDNIDPFKTKSTVLNSPSLSKVEMEDERKFDNGIIEVHNSFETKTTIVSSPTSLRDSEASDIENVDPFKTKSAVMNSPPLLKAVQEKEASIEQNANMDPFKTKSAVMNSPLLQKAVPENEAIIEQDASMDPFKTKSAVMNSPLLQKAVPENEAIIEQDASMDPFKTKSDVMNSPLLQKAVPENEAIIEQDASMDPFKTKSAIMNSPLLQKAVPENEAIIEQDISMDPFKTKSAVMNSPLLQKAVPENEAIIEQDASMDPFKTKSAVMNSPLLQKAVPENEAIIEQDASMDPFKTKSAVMNSPLLQKAVPENEAIIEQDASMDPFKTKSAVMNSPLLQKAVPENEAINEQDASMDPFKTKSALMNSPPLNELQKTVPENEVSVEQDDTMDPFKTKSTIVNSPCRHVGNTKDYSEHAFDNEDPFKTKSVVANSPAGYSEQDNCKDNENMDPIKSKSTVLNSPSGVRLRQDQDNRTSLNNIEKSDEKMSGLVTDKPPCQLDEQTATGTYKLDNLDSIVPFKTTSSVQNSPGQSEKYADRDSIKTDSQPNCLMETTTENSCNSLPDEKDGVETVRSASEILPDQPPEEIGTRGSYNLDLCNLDSLDPFKTKSGLMNSPIKSDAAFQNVNSNTQFNLTEDKQMGTSCKSSAKQGPHASDNTELQNSCSTTTYSLNSENLDEINPFITKSGLPNSPVKGNAEDHSFNSLTKCEEDIDVDIQSSKVSFNKAGQDEKVTSSCATSGYSLDLDSLDSINPFASKSAVANSPQSKKSTDSNNIDRASSVQLKDCNNPETGDTVENSFEDMDNTVIECTKPIPESSKNIDSDMTGLDGSGISDEQFDLVDPFQSQSETVSCAGKDNVINEAPVGNDQIDIRGGTQEERSSKALDEVPDIDLSSDPFKCSKTIPNSPPQQNSLSSKKTVSPLDNETSVEISEDIDPFKPKTQIQTSPEIREQITIDKSNEGQLKPESPPQQHGKSSAVKSGLDLCDFDAFTSTNKIPNSPRVGTSLGDQEGLTSLPEDNGTKELQQPDCLIDAKNFICSSRKNPAATPEIEESEEEFKPATEVFNDPSAWDMLEQFGSGTDESKQSALARMSLYVKFDPLVNAAVPSKTPENKREKRMEVINPNNTLDMSKSVMEESLLLMGTPPKKKRASRRKPTEPKLPVPLEIDEFEKPAVDLIFDAIPSSGGSLEATGDSGEFNSVSSQISGEDECEEENIVQVLKYSESDWKRLKRHLGMELQGKLLSKENNWNKKFVVQGKETEKLKAENEKIKKEISTMSVVVAEYEKLISQLIAEKERCSSDSKDSVENLRKERDQALQDVQAVENTFADLHRRYEKMKGILESYRKNEAALTKSTQDSLENLKKNEQNFQNFKKQSEATIQKQLKEIEKLKASNQTELLRIETLSKKKDLQIQSLQKSLEQKEQEVKELTDLSDQLLASIEGKS